MMDAPGVLPERCDALVVGGGLTGCALALALAGGGATVALVERYAPRERAAVDARDERPIALAQASRRILESLGAWDGIAPHACPIRVIHVSDRGHFGFTRMRARDLGVDALGYVVDAATIGHALAVAARALPQIAWCAPATVAAMEQGTDGVVVRLDGMGVRGSGMCNASLLVAADGSGSKLGALTGARVHESDYGQVAITATVTPRHAHGNVAYERFTDNGPLALLPLGGGGCGLVWSVSPARAERLAALGDEAFLEALGDAFGMRLGGFQAVASRACHPLRRTRNLSQARERTVFVGNAAHTLHPVAGQGFNLGLRDVAWLAETVLDAHRAGKDPGAAATLQRYLAHRRADQRAVGLFTDLLVGAFSNRFPPLVVARDLGMLGLDLLPPLKGWLARRAMGLGGAQPRLARGLPA